MLLVYKAWDLVTYFFKEIKLLMKSLMLIINKKQSETDILCFVGGGGGVKREDYSFLLRILYRMLKGFFEAILSIINSLFLSNVSHN